MQTKLLNSDVITVYVKDLEDKNTLMSLMMGEYSDLLAEAIKYMFLYANEDAAQKLVASYVKKMSKYSDYMSTNPDDKKMFDDAIKSSKTSAEAKKTAPQGENEEKSPT